MKLWVAETPMPMTVPRCNMAKKTSKAFNKRVGNKIKKILKEGVRRNTHAPVSKSNPRRKVSQAQAVAIAENMIRRGKA